MVLAGNGCHRRGLYGRGGSGYRVLREATRVSAADRPVQAYFSATARRQVLRGHLRHAPSAYSSACSGGRSGPPLSPPASAIRLATLLLGGELTRTATLPCSAAADICSPRLIPRHVLVVARLVPARAAASGKRGLAFAFSPPGRHQHFGLRRRSEAISISHALMNRRDDRGVQAYGGVVAVRRAFWITSPALLPAVGIGAAFWPVVVLGCCSSAAQRAHSARLQLLTSCEVELEGRRRLPAVKTWPVLDPAP